MLARSHLRRRGRRGVRDTPVIVILLLLFFGISPIRLLIGWFVITHDCRACRVLWRAPHSRERHKGADTAIFFLCADKGLLDYLRRIYSTSSSRLAAQYQASIRRRRQRCGGALLRSCCLWKHSQKRAARNVSRTCFSKHSVFFLSPVLSSRIHRSIFRQTVVVMIMGRLQCYRKKITTER